MKKFTKIAAVALLALALTGVSLSGGRGGLTAFAASDQAPSVSDVEGSKERTEGSLRYIVIDGGAAVSGCDGDAKGAVEIPAALGGKPVIAVCDSAFSGCDGVTAVTLPDTLRSVGNSAFAGCASLKEINLPDGLRTIGIDAFSGCGEVVVTNRSDKNVTSVIATESPCRKTGRGDSEVFLDIITPKKGDGSFQWGTSYPDAILKHLRDALLAVSTEQIDVSGCGIQETDQTLRRAAVSDMIGALVRKYPYETVAANYSTYMYSYTYSGEIIGITFSYADSATVSSVSQRLSRLKSVAEPNVSALSGKSDYEKIIRVHDILALSSEYDYNYAVYDAYTLLTEGTGVCQAYTEAFRFYMNLLDVPCVTATSGDMNHIWNMVWLDGAWYHIDVTWDDPTTGDPNYCTYEHTLVNDSEITALDHYGWVSSYTSTSTAYSSMPRGNNGTQFFSGGKWYVCDTQNTKLTSCSAKGGSVAVIANDATGGVCVYDGTVLYGANDTVKAYDPSSAHAGKVCSLTSDDLARSDINRDNLTCRIQSLTVDGKDNLHYGFRVWKATNSQNGYTYYQSETVESTHTVSLSSFLGGLKQYRQKLDALDSNVSTQAQATAAQTVLSLYDSFSDLQKTNIDQTRVSKTEALRASLAEFSARPQLITAQPKSQSGAVNSKVTFSVKASGDGLTYQWYYRKAGENNFTAWSGRTGASATATVYASWNNSEYYCEVTDAQGQTDRSETVTLSVATSVTQQPKDATAAVGEKVTFTVKATGAGISYRWYYKKADASAWTEWKNGTSSTLTATVYNSWNNAKFYCKITDANGKTVNSGSARMLVASSLAVTTQPVNASGAVGDKVTFTMKATGAGLKYQWYYKKADASGWTAWKNGTSASLTAPVYASWHNTKFYCKITDVNGKTVNSGSAKMLVTTKITQQPANVSGAVGDKVTLSFKATGAGLTYQWYYKKAGASSWTKWSGKTSASVAATVYQSWHNCQYYCVVTDSSGQTFKTDTVRLTVR